MDEYRQNEGSGTPGTERSRRRSGVPGVAAGGEVAWAGGDSPEVVEGAARPTVPGEGGSSESASSEAEAVGSGEAISREAPSMFRTPTSRRSGPRFTRGAPMGFLVPSYCRGSNYGA